MGNKSSTSSRSPEDVQGQPVAKKTRLVYKTIIYDESKPNQWLEEPPLEVWDHVIIPMLGLKDLALARPVCTFFEAYWQDKFSNNVLPLRVGLDVATIDDVMGVIEILSSRREYTKINPFVVLLGEGDHPITSTCICTTLIGYEHPTTLGITRSNVTFLGAGKDTTTVLGGFLIINQENITFKQMTVTNIGNGIRMEGAQVELVDAATSNCTTCGIYVRNAAGALSQLVATRCEMSNNGTSGLTIVNPRNNNNNLDNMVSIWAALTAPFRALIPFNVCLKNCIFEGNYVSGILLEGKGVVNVHGNATAIHSNRWDGIVAVNSAKVFIHLPSHHNTSYNNGREDRLTSRGGTITNVED